MSISILLPFHNAAPWLAQTIRSIQNQSLADWELIALDDFSTDNSRSILQKIAKEDSRIRIYQNQVKGIIPALQLGLSHAKREFLTRMDADDLMPEGRLKIMMERLKALPEKSVITGKVKYFSQKDGVHFDKLNASREPDTSISDGYLSYEAWLNERIDKQDHYDHIYRECVVASPNWMTRTQEMIESRIFSNLNYPEDYDMTFRWMEQGFSIHSINETTLFWREHPGRTSRNSEVYDQASFFDLKLNWFCRLHDTTSVAILGAGVKGKITASFLKDREIDFNWYDLEWKKYGSPIFGTSIQNYELIQADKLMIAIFPENKKPLLDFITEKGFEIGRNAWFL
ncbi:MAG: glycosyltransferase family 2 protein [Crocinitomicaceae bacterium]